MKSIKGKLISLYVSVVFIATVVSGTYIILTLNNQDISNAERQLKEYATYIEKQVIESNDPAYFDFALTNRIAKNTSFTSYQGHIIDQTGQTIATTTGDMDQRFTNQIIIEALLGRPAFSASKWEKYSVGPIAEWISYAQPASKNGETYVIFVQMNGAQISANIARNSQIIVFSLILSLFVAIVMGYIFATTITVPISGLTQKAKELAKGNLKQRAEVFSTDEIGQLTQSFNHMSQELERSMKDISEEKIKLETILRNMADGVLSFDKDGHLILANPVSYEMLGMAPGSQFTYMEFVKQYDINSGVIIDLDNYSAKQITFYTNNRYIGANFAPYTNEHGKLWGIVVVLQDITEHKKLDDMRKEFVANVSHELRTPLTTVKSYTETLLDGAMEDGEVTKSFLEIIDSEANRMTLLITDLLQLSRFDNEQMNLNMEKIYLEAFLQEKIAQSKIHAENKKQTISLSIDDPGRYIQGDRDRITQVVINIINNAIKYSPEESHIAVSTGIEDEHIFIKIEDNGIGIPKEDQDRIFERFYRVDKARSRAMGGTGLGLAIANDIMNAHGGKISVQSELGAGTTMILSFPKCVKSQDQ